MTFEQWPEWARVLEAPGSNAAREALSRRFRESGEMLRADLIDKQITLRKLWSNEWSSAAACNLREEIAALLGEHGARLAGPVKELVSEYEFHRGLVAAVTLAGARFMEVAPELFSIAPVQHLSLRDPLGSFAAISASPYFGRLTSLSVSSKRFGDDEVRLLANAPHAEGLLWIDLSDCNVTNAGQDIAAQSSTLSNAKMIGFGGNPCDAIAPQFHDYGYGVEPVQWLPPRVADLKARFGPRTWLEFPEGYGQWPPGRDDLAVTD